MSRTISAVVPPWPKLMIGPNVASSATRMRSSRQRTAWRCTSRAVPLSACRGRWRGARPARRGRACGTDLRRVVQVQRQTAGRSRDRAARSGAASPPRGSPAALPPPRHRRPTRRHGSAPPGCRRPTAPSSASSCIAVRRPARRMRANTPRTASRSGATVSTALVGSSRAAARLRRSCTRWQKAAHRLFGRGEHRHAGLGQARGGARLRWSRPWRRPAAAPAWRRGRRSAPSIVARSAFASAGTCTTSTPPTFGLRQLPLSRARPGARPRRAPRARCRRPAAARRAAPHPPPSGRR